MKNLQIFVYGGEQLRTIQRDDGLWWVLRDVCRVLGIANHKMVAQRLDEDEVSLADLIDAMGRTQKTIIINEPGLYAVILRSDKPEAKQFKRWVTHDVLPTIRRTGSYTMPPQHAQQITNLQLLQRSLKKWRGLENDFAELATEARQRYEQNRNLRDQCRAEVQKLERQIDNAILLLGAER